MTAFLLLLRLVLMGHMIFLGFMLCVNFTRLLTKQLSFKQFFGNIKVGLLAPFYLLTAKSRTRLLETLEGLL